MASNRVFRSVLLGASVLAMAGCAAQPEGSLLEMKFERAARQYDRTYQYKGQTVYCMRGATRSLPPTECITESALRLQVDLNQRSRNPAARGGPQYVATVPGGSGGG
jgi:hypothetical protein